MTDSAYAGDLTPKETWKILEENPASVMVDVRTPAEWGYVGVSDLTSLGKQPVFLPWVNFPEMQRNPDFTSQLAELVVDREAPLLFLCRSGQRSKAAAIAMTSLGYTQCFNVDSGFEGDKDDAHHRGVSNGWKVDNLPWAQG